MMKKNFWILVLLPFLCGPLAAICQTPDQTLQKALQFFIGNPSVSQSEVKKLINELDNQQYGMAKAWKGAFLYFGEGGFPINEALGASLLYDQLDMLITKNSENDPQASYLLYLACYMRISHPKINHDQAMPYLEASMAKQFVPAVLMRGQLHYFKGEYWQALTIFQNAYQSGAKAAARRVGAVYANKQFSGYDIQKSVEWFQLGATAGDEDAMYQLARIYFSGEHTQPNWAESWKWAKPAAAKGHTGTLSFLGDVFLKDHSGKAKNSAIALQCFTKAAERGDREAMLALSFLYQSGTEIGTQDNGKAFEWLKKSAEEGHPRAMYFLGQAYADGEFAPKDQIRSRYWLNQASIRGVGSGSDKPQQQQLDVFDAIFQYGDFSNTYTFFQDEDGDMEVIDNGPDIAFGLLSGLLGGWMASHENPQEVINGVAFIQEINGRKIYGGTLTTTCQTNITVKVGQKIKMTVAGEVSLGMMAGSTGPAGLGGRTFDPYSITTLVNHGGCMAKIGYGDWFSTGLSKEFAATESGSLTLGINDKDHTNNKGYYDVRIEISE